MRILRTQASLSAAYYNCHIETGYRTFSIEKRVLFDDGNVIVGPLKIIKEETRKIVVTADDDYAIYKRIDADSAELVDLEQITLQDYETVTSSIFLDGFLSAAYQDNSGIVRVDIDPSMQGLKNYYTKLMNENGIEYRITEDGFVFPDSSIVQAVFEKQENLMPPKYVIGFMSSFIVKSKVRINSNPRYARYIFILHPAEEYYEGLAPSGMYYYSLRGQRALFSIFGSFEPLAQYIDCIDTSFNEPVFTEAIHYDDIFREVAPELIIKSFALSGLNPRIIRRDDSMIYLKLSFKENNQPYSILLAVSSDNLIPAYDCDYMVRFEDRKPLLYDISENGKENNNVENLLYHPAFNFSKELRDYLQIIFNKM